MHVDQLDLEGIAERAAALAKVGERMPPPDAPEAEMSTWLVGLLPELEALERLLNPDWLPFGDWRRHPTGPAEVVEPLACLGAAVDRILRALSLEDLAHKPTRPTPDMGGEVEEPDERQPGKTCIVHFDHTYGDLCPFPRPVAAIDPGEWGRLRAAAEALRPGAEAGEVAKHKEELESQGTEQPLTRHGSGPVEPDGFAWEGPACRGLPPRPFRLVKVLFGNLGQAVAFADLAEPVWGDREELVAEGAVASARREANRFFAHHGLPFRVTIKNGTATLQKRP